MRLRLLDRFLDRADHVEGGLGQVVILASHRPLKPLIVSSSSTELAGRAGEHFGDEEGLRQEALDLAGAGDGELVLFRKLVHAQNGDDVLQRLVALEDLTCTRRAIS